MMVSWLGNTFCITGRFVRGIHWLSVDSLYSGPVIQSLGVFFGISPNKLLNKQSSSRWIKMSWHSCDVTGMWIFMVVVLQYWIACNCCKRTNWSPGPRLNIKTVLSTYGDFHVKDKTAVRTSYLNMGIAIPGKTFLLIETAPRPV